MTDARPSLDTTLMRTAQVWAQRSTCSRAQVGAVLSIDTRILVQGYNGAPAGMRHCDHSCDCRPHEFDGIHHAKHCRSFQPCTEAEHAERNAVAYAARRGIALDGATAHVTKAPCITCAWTLVNAGIVRVVWHEVHRDMTGITYLLNAGVQIEQWVDANLVEVVNA